MITSLDGTAARVLGLAAHPEQDPRCCRRAYQRGINYFFVYSPGHARFIEGLSPLIRNRRGEIIVATGSGARKRSTLRAARRRILAALRVDVLDVFFAEYIQPDDRIDDVFASGGVLDELCVWKTQGTIRYVGASVHDRTLARRLVQDPRIDVLMHRYNMAHRKATNDVFPAAIETQTPVVAFTATRWGTLLTHRTEWPGDPPSAADCYRYCLAHPAVKLVLTAPRSLNELDENLEVLDKPTMSKRDRVRWERFGDLVHGCGKDAFETRWP